MESEEATKSENEDKPRKLWDERVFMHFPHVKYLTLETKRNALENICNPDLCYWRSRMINSFILLMKKCMVNNERQVCGS